MNRVVQPYDGSRQTPDLQQAEDDRQLVSLWLHGKSPQTQEAYLRDVNQFVDFVDRPLQQVILQDLQNWSDELEQRGLADATRARKLAAVKSLFSFGHKIGYFVFNVGAAIATPKVKDDLAERILPRDIVHRVLQMADNLRDAVLLRLFYSSGGRVSELAALRWKAAVARPGKSGKTAGQIALHGKGDKTRNVLLSASTWSELLRLQRQERDSGFGNPHDPIFRSRKGGHLSRQQLWYIVKRAAQRAGCEQAVSPHWLRHAHASHALDEGAPVHLVKETLGHKSLATTSRYTHARPDDSSATYLDV